MGKMSEDLKKHGMKIFGHVGRNDTPVFSKKDS